MERKTPDECDVGDHLPDMVDGEKSHGFSEDAVAMFHPLAPSAEEMLASGLTEWEQETWIFKKEKSSDGQAEHWLRIK